MFILLKLALEILVYIYSKYELYNSYSTLYIIVYVFSHLLSTSCLQCSFSDFQHKIVSQCEKSIGLDFLDNSQYL